MLSGASGLIGQALVPALLARGHSVRTLVRREARGPDELSWDGRTDLPAQALDGVDAVVNLSGANVGEGRWSDARKQTLRDSRLHATQAWVRALARAPARPPARPRILLNASAVGFYGNRGEEPLDEGSVRGSGFLSELCVDWEQEAMKAADAGTRVVCLRFGVVLGRGGALAQMLPAVRAGVGGRLGSGEQWMSWVALRDAVGVIEHALEAGDLKGSVNVVSPQPIRNKDFTAELCRAVHRWVGPPVPAWALRTLFGAMAEETLLSSTKALPQALSRSAYRFALPGVQDALAEALSGR